MSVLATHTKEHLNKALNAYEHINKKLKIARQFINLFVLYKILLA
jgi:hypothetical protein